MNTTTKTASVLAVVIGLGAALSCAQAKTDSAEIRSVSAATIYQLSAGETFEIDLTKRGVIYSFEDPNVDFSRVTVRTTTGVKPFSEVLKASNSTPRGRLTLGRTEDMRNHLPTSGGAGTSAYDCGVFCKCNGVKDCVDMYEAGKCSAESWCSSGDTNITCYCLAKA